MGKSSKKSLASDYSQEYVSRVKATDLPKPKQDLQPQIAGNEENLYCCNYRFFIYYVSTW